MKISIDRKRFQLYLWLGAAYYLLWLFIDLSINPETFLERAWNHVWLISYVIVINFIFFEYSLPYIKVSWKRILVGLVLIWVHVMLCSFGLYAWRTLGIGLHLYFPLITHASVFKGVEYHVPYSIFSGFFFGIIKHIYDYRKLKEAAQQLRIEKQEAELNYLKSQTNPHFLFNTLNNIYSLARDKSDLAPESILRLSKILRYMLYETGGEFIAIEQELKIISDYISLEKLRYDDSLHVNFNYDIEDMKQAFPPLLLIPLVENAFKHGVSETRTRPFVDIHLSVGQRQLVFVVKNSAESLPQEIGVKESIGLSNLRRQLKLLYTDYSLSVEQFEFVFTATLKINLASHV
ncbi:MAG: histidine kinase [Ignavibacteriae bacterium]|nr:histidine kinase [Ignavibacteriota bacterium]